ncbi:MAG: response regulator [Planctomycetota bacterium]
MNSPPLILLIDDDPDFLDINRRVLEAAGYRVAAFTDAKSALASMAAEKPALIMSDLMMANLDSGFSLCKQIKDDPRLADVPIILATAASSQLGLDFRPRMPEDLAAMKIDAYFDKPIPPKTLLAKVAELLSRSTPSPG